MRHCTRRDCQRNNPQPLKEFERPFRSGPPRLFRTCNHCANRVRRSVRRSRARAQGADVSDERGGRYFDPWHEVCQRCSLPDCIRKEGDITPNGVNAGYPGCAVWEANRRGWGPGEALAQVDVLELREAVIWLEY